MMCAKHPSRGSCSDCHLFRSSRAVALLLGERYNDSRRTGKKREQRCPECFPRLKRRNGHSARVPQLPHDTLRITQDRQRQFPALLNSSGLGKTGKVYRKSTESRNTAILPARRGTAGQGCPPAAQAGKPVFPRFADFQHAP